MKRIRFKSCLLFCVLFIIAHVVGFLLSLPKERNPYYGLEFCIFDNSAAEELAKAVAREHTTAIKRILSQGHVPIDFKDSEYGHTLLTLAVIQKKEKSVSTLLELGADPNARGDSIVYEGLTPVLAAVYYNSTPSILSELLRYGGNPSATFNGDGSIVRGYHSKVRESALQCAIRNGYHSSVKILVEAGADIDYYDEIEHSDALRTSLSCDELDIALYLLRKGADFTHKYNSLMFNSKMNYYKDVDILFLLRECLYTLGSVNYQKKMKIVDFLGVKGLDYRNSPIPEETKERWETSISLVNTDFDYYVAHY